MGKQCEREREREDVGLFLRRVSLHILREKRQKRMLGPIPAARARKTRWNTFRDHAPRYTYEIGSIVESREDGINGDRLR